MSTTGNRKETITIQLENAFKKANRRLTDQEVRDNSSLPDPAEYAYHYGSYSAAANYVWRRINPVNEGSMKLTPLAIAMLKKREQKT